MKTINVSDALHTKLKIFCATYQHSLASVVTQALEESLIEYTRAEELARKGP